MNIKHSDLAQGNWRKLSLAEQLGNIGSEVNRAFRFQNKDQQLLENAFDRALELFDLTISDPRWRHRLKEITRAREVFCDAILGGNKYNSSPEDLNRYFYYFALAARLSK
ncbi:MAG: hypothetical protein KGZ93_07030 [Actinobacteria bacterium]|nr:hypothetical protein [Actinomycetota bacterium]